MRILAFETSAKSASAALLEDGLLVGEYMQNSGQTHSRTVMAMAEALLHNCDVSPKEIDAVACSGGPGSFTGIRIGMAAAKGFAWGRELPLYPVSTLEAMAWYAASADGLVCPVMDARRGQVYTALFSMEDGVLRREMDDCAISLEELRQQLSPFDSAISLVGDGAKLCWDTWKEVLPLRLLPEHLRHQRASGVALAAWAAIRDQKPPALPDTGPNYLRLSQAERERLKKEGKT